MMQYIITTTVRSSQTSEDSGHAYALDYGRWEITGRTPIPSPLFLKCDTNPRGGARGGKGVAADGDTVWISNADHIHCFGPNWNLVRSFTHPSCAMIHDIERDGRALWVASTCNDLLMKFNEEGALVDFFDIRLYPAILEQVGLNDLRPWSRDRILAGTLDFRDPRTHVLEETDRLHLNAVCRLPDGDFLMSFGRVTTSKMKLLWKWKVAAMRVGSWDNIVRANRLIARLLRAPRQRHTNLVAAPGSYRALVVRWTPEGACRVLLDLPGLMVPNHTLIHVGEHGVLYNDTDKGEVVIFDPDSGTERARIFVDRTFLRGAALVSEDHVLVGSQNRIFLVNIRTHCVERALQIDEDTRSAVHGIARTHCRMAAMPERFPVYSTMECEGVGV